MRGRHYHCCDLPNEQSFSLYTALPDAGLNLTVLHPCMHLSISFKGTGDFVSCPACSTPDLKFKFAHSEKQTWRAQSEKRLQLSCDKREGRKHTFRSHLRDNPADRGTFCLRKKSERTGILPLIGFSAQTCPVYRISTVYCHASHSQIEYPP
jgi:hypothetical protein